jgi:hypothetical protein
MGTVDINVHNMRAGLAPITTEVCQFHKDAQGNLEFVTLRFISAEGNQVTFFLPDKLAVLDLAVSMINQVNGR